MRKLCFVLTALLLTAPAFADADVEVTCAQVALGDANVVVSYSASNDANVPRGFGLNITVDSGKTISDIKAGSVSGDYWVYPGTIEITDGSVTGDGTPIAPKDTNYANREEGGLGTNGVTLEMGSLYHVDDLNHPNKPSLTGALLTLTISGLDCNVSIGGNAARGNVVLEDATEAVVDYNGCYLAINPDCYTGPDYATWVSIGKPTEWCNPRQCHGDADAAQELIGKGSFWVGFNDLNQFIAAWQDVSLDYACDFDHGQELIGKGSFWVGFNDLNVFIANWQDVLGTPPDCLTGSPASP